MPKYVVPFTEVEERTMIDLYAQGFALAYISKIIGYDCSRINRFLKKKGIRLRKRTEYHKYCVNNDYFETIDSKEKAAILGLLYADGCNDGKRNCVVISLHQRDKETLEILRDCLDSDYKIKCYERQRNLRGKPHTEKVAAIYFFSKKMCDDLSKLGCVPRKSKIKKFPKLKDPELIKSFVYGYFLGNGCLCLRKDKSYIATITSTKQMCIKFKKLFAKLGIKSCICLKKGSKNIRIIYVTGIKRVKIAMDWVFSGEMDLMKRKQDKYKELVTTHNNRYPITEPNLEKPS